MMKHIALVLICLLASTAASAADCFIWEYDNLTRGRNGRDVPVAPEPIATQQVTYTTSTQSAAFNNATRFIRIVCTAKAHAQFGASPTATAAMPYIPTDTPEYFGVEAGNKVAFYDGTS